MNADEITAVGKVSQSQEGRVTDVQGVSVRGGDDLSCRPAKRDFDPQPRLRRIADDEPQQPEAKQTKYGSLYVESEPMSRAAKRTKNNIDANFGPEEAWLLEQAQRTLAAEPIVSIDVEVGDGRRESPPG